MSHYRDADLVKIAVAMGDTAELNRLAWEARRETARLHAAIGARNTEALADLAAGAKRATVRARAAAAIGDEDSLLDVAETSLRPAARAIALKALQVGKAGTADPVVHDARRFVRAARRVGLTDPEIESLIRRAMRQTAEVSDPLGGAPWRHDSADGNGRDRIVRCAPRTTVGANPNAPGSPGEKE